MSIETLTYTNARGESIEFSVNSMYRVNVSRDVSGLSGTLSELNTVSSMGQDGSKFVSSRVLARDIEIIGYIKNGDKILERNATHELARVLDPHIGGVLTYKMDDYMRFIYCRSVSSPAIKRDMLLTQFAVQLSALNPYWQTDTINKPITAWKGLMQFPLTIPAPVSGVKKWEIGEREDNKFINCINDGDVAVGMTVTFRAAQAVANPKILNIHTEEYIRLVYQMKKGDVITVSTGYGEKRVTLFGEDGVKDAFNILDPASTYIWLQPGDNEFKDVTKGDDGDVNLDITISYNNAYLAV